MILQPTDDQDIFGRRNAALSMIVEDDTPRRLVVAGPGTGKTFMFRKALERNNRSALVLTFLSSLADDLRDELGDLAHVYTFHGFACWLLYNTDVPDITRNVDYYPAIDIIYQQDLSLFDTDATQDTISDVLMNLVDGPILDQVLQSGSYYDAVGFVDSVYRVLHHLRENPAAVPLYGLVIVDEYQDFGRLEVELLELLADASPILVAGDDDQALYGFRHASAAHLRRLAADPRYAYFELPFCSRCTAIMVEAVHRVVSQAQAIGLLADRLKKPYVCFMPAKREASERYPRITHAHCSVDRGNAPYVGRYVASVVRQIPAADIAESRAGGYPTVLVIGPTHFSRRVSEVLGDEFANVRFKTSDRPTVRSLDGYRRLVDNRNSRLGWRILLNCHQPEGWSDAVREALKESKDLRDLVDPTYRDEQLAVTDLLSRLAEGNANPEEMAKAAEITDLPLDDLLLELVGERRVENDEIPDRGQGDDIPEGPTILVTSLVGAKGLQASHVFVVGVNEGHFPVRNHQPTENEVCELLVALTRGRKSCTLVSTRRFAGSVLQPSLFDQWLHPFLDTVYVDRSYFA